MLKKAAALVVILAAAFGVMMLATAGTTFTAENFQVVAQPVPAVWRTLTEVEKWPAWWPGVTRAELPAGWHQGATLIMALKGTPARAPARVKTVDPERELAWERDGILGSETRTTLRLVAVGGGTRITMTSSIRGPQAFLARLTIKREFGKYHQAVLGRLERYLETAGREVPPGKD